MNSSCSEAQVDQIEDGDEVVQDEPDVACSGPRPRIGHVIGPDVTDDDPQGSIEAPRRGKQDRHDKRANWVKAPSREDLEPAADLNGEVDGFEDEHVDSNHDFRATVFN